MPILATIAVLLLLAGIWQFTPLRESIDLDRIAGALEPYRRHWLAFPVTMLIFVVATLLMFPVLALIFLCGIVFGPWLGAAYAACGSVASALIPFFVGRRLGRERVARIGGRLVERVDNVLRRRGVIAVFLVRKIPAPYTLVNLVCGALGVGVRDFVLGTLLGMGTGIIVITVLGGQLFHASRRPEPSEILMSVGLLFVPLAIALLVQRQLNRQQEAAP